MLLYFDKTGRGIDQHEWRTLSRVPAYCTLALHREGRLAIMLEWVGIASVIEKPPKPFLLTAKLVGLNGQGGQVIAGPTWLPGPDRALEEFKKLRQELAH